MKKTGPVGSMEGESPAAVGTAGQYKKPDGRGCGPCTRIEKTRKSAQRIFSGLREQG